MLGFEDALSNSIYLLSTNKITEGKNELERIITYEPQNTYVLNLLAICEYKYCNFINAKIYIDRSYGIEKSKVTIYYRTKIHDIFKNGFAYEYYDIIKGIGDRELNISIKKLESIKKSNPDLIEPYILLSIIYFKYKRMIKSRQNIAKAYKLDNSNYNINNLYLKLKL